MKYDRAKEIAGVVCDKLCKYPGNAEGERLERICKSCPLWNELCVEILGDVDGGKRK